MAYLLIEGCGAFCGFRVLPRTVQCTRKDPKEILVESRISNSEDSTASAIGQATRSRTVRPIINHSSNMG
jgi:hypothetical protein